jgi:multidrug efflux system membrane fusion protein
MACGQKATSSSSSPASLSGRSGRGRGDAVPVATTHVVSKEMPVVVSAVGTVEAIVSVQVRAQTTGQLSGVQFAEGADVKQGQPLFTIDPRPFEAALQQARAVLARDTAQLSDAHAQRARNASLFERGLIARADYEAQAATAASLEATLAADRAQIEQAQLNLQYARIAAPVAGRAGALNAHPGDLIRANDQTPLVTINQLSPIYVTFAVPSRFLAEIRLHQRQHPLAVTVRANTERAASPRFATDASSAETAEGDPAPTDMGPVSKGTLTFIDNAVDTTTGTIKLKATFENADRLLWPGLFVAVSLTLSAEPHAIVVPAIAVQPSQQGSMVYVVTTNRTAEPRSVTVQRQQGDESVIASGLAAGEEVVTDGQLRLTPGARVATANATGADRGSPRAQP